MFRHPDYEEWTEEEAAGHIRNAVLTSWKAALREPPPVIQEGLAFKFPWSPKAYHVAYMDEEYFGYYERRRKLHGIAWITENGSRYGSLVPLEWDGWQVISRSSAKTGGAGENKDGWKPGDFVTFAQGLSRFKVLQVTSSSVLLQDRWGGLRAEPNDIMKQFRRLL